jgi:hypothetical protein
MGRVVRNDAADHVVVEASVRARARAQRPHTTRALLLACAAQWTYAHGHLPLPPRAGQGASHGARDARGAPQRVRGRASARAVVVGGGRGGGRRARPPPSPRPSRAHALAHSLARHPTRPLSGVCAASWWSLWAPSARTGHSSRCVRARGGGGALLPTEARRARTRPASASTPRHPPPPMVTAGGPRDRVRRVLWHGDVQRARGARQRRVRQALLKPVVAGCLIMNQARAAAVLLHVRSTCERLDRASSSDLDADIDARSR